MSGNSNAETDAARFNKGVLGVPEVPGVTGIDHSVINSNSDSEPSELISIGT